MLTSYHVHSTYSDGKAPISEIVRAAVDLKLDELGVSDHYVHLAHGQSVSWSMRQDEIARYVKEIKTAAEAVEGRLAVRIGIEADFTPQSAEGLADVLASHPFDYVIGSVHFVDGFPIDESSDYWDKLSQPERNDMVRAYWDRIARMAKSGLFDFAGHLDLYKKFGHCPTVDLTTDVNAALDAIAASGMAVEINTAGYFLPAREAYPSPQILTGCFGRGIPVLINADAHVPANLTRGYERARGLVAGVGYTHTAVYAERQMRLAPISL